MPRVAGPPAVAQTPGFWVRQPSAAGRVQGLQALLRGGPVRALAQHQRRGLLNEKANLHPATKAGASLPALSKGVAFYGDQKIYEIFAQAFGHVSPDFTGGRR